MNSQTEGKEKEMNAQIKKDDEASSTCVEEEEEDELLEVSIPSQFICPLTLDIMKDPLVSRHGQSYEREAIMSWLGAGNTTCPMTRKPLRLVDLISNHRLKTQIECWKEANPQYQKKKAARSDSEEEEEDVLDRDTEKFLGMFLNYEGTEHSQEDPDIILEWRRPTEDDETPQRRRRGLLDRFRSLRRNGVSTA
jgi:U-box domain